MIDIQKIRSDFPILEKNVYGKPLVYLDNAATTQMPRVVLESVTHHYENSHGNIHRGLHYLSDAASEAYENARRAVQRFINAENENQIIFTSGTTGAINLFADSFGQAFIKPGDEIIITRMEHHSNIVPWQVLCRRRGAVLKAIPLDPEGGLMVDRLPDLMTKKTRLVACCQVSNALGLVNPVKKIVDMAHEKGIPVLIDGAQSIPHFAIDVQDIGCDFFAFSGHKMYALTGTGVLYAKEKFLERMPPYQTGGGMVRQVGVEKTAYQGVPSKFEAGTPHVAGAVSMAAAIGYLLEIGFEQIAGHEDELISHALNTLKQINGLTVYGVRYPRCGVIPFNLAGIHPLDLGMFLDKMGIAVRAGQHCAEPVMNHFGITGTLRASIALYNRREEIDYLCESITRAKKLLL